MKNKIIIFGLYLIAVLAAAVLFVFSSAAPAKASNPLFFSAVQGTATPTTQDSRSATPTPTFNIVNTTPLGGENMTWFFTSNVTWLSASQTCLGSTGCATVGSLAPGASSTVTITPNTTNLTPGSYVGTVTVNANNTTGAVSTPASTTVTINYTINPPCTNGGVNAAAGTVSTSPIAWNTATTLSWTSANCTSATLKGGQFGAAGTAEPVNSPVGGVSTGALTATTTFTFTPCGSAQCAAAASVTVNVAPQPCTINVVSVYNGSANTLPPSGYNYTITGSSTINGSNQTGATPWSVPPGATWTIAATPLSANVSLVDYAPGGASQSCLTAGGSITFTVNTKDNPPPAPGALTVQNNALSAAVACTHIKLSWGASTNTTSYWLYRSVSTGTPTAGGSPWVDTGNTLTTYDYVPTAADQTVAYFYWVAAHNAGGTSTLVGPAPASAITPTPCSTDFTVSNKVISKINGKAFPITTDSSSTNNASINCLGAQAGTKPTTIKLNDVITWNINICNLGNLDASNVIVSDVLTDLTPVAGSYQLTTSPPTVTSAITPVAGGTCATGTCTLTFTIASIPKSTNAVISFNTTVTAATGATQTLQRFRNQASFTYTVAGQVANNGGCTGTGTDAAHPCVPPDPGLVVFFNGPKAPNQIETTP